MFSTLWVLGSGARWHCLCRNFSLKWPTEEEEVLTPGHLCSVPSLPRQVAVISLVLQEPVVYTCSIFYRVSFQDHWGKKKKMIILLSLWILPIIYKTMQRNFRIVNLTRKPENICCLHFTDYLNVEIVRTRKHSTAEAGLMMSATPWHQKSLANYILAEMNPVVTFMI